MAPPALCSEAPPAKASDASLASVPCALTDAPLQAQRMPLMHAGDAVAPAAQGDQGERRQDAARRIQASVRQSQGSPTLQATVDQRRAEEILQGRLRPQSGGIAFANDAVALGADEDAVDVETETDDSEGEDAGNSPAASEATTADTQIDMPLDELPFLPTFGADKRKDRLGISPAKSSGMSVPGSSFEVPPPDSDADCLMRADFEAATLVFAPPSRAKVSTEESPQASAAQAALAA